MGARSEDSLGSWRDTSLRPTATGSPTSTTSGTRSSIPRARSSFSPSSPATGACSSSRSAAGGSHSRSTARGVEVHGIDASERMVERLRAKPGGEELPVTMGDFADVAVEGTFRVVSSPSTRSSRSPTRRRRSAASSGCRRAPRRERRVRARGVRARPRALRPRPARVVDPHEARPHRARRVAAGRRLTDRLLPARPHLRRGDEALPRAGAVRVADRARPHGEAGRPPAPRALRGLGAVAVHGLGVVAVSVYERA